MYVLLQEFFSNKQKKTRADEKQVLDNLHLFSIMISGV